MENKVDFDALAGKFFAAQGEETYCDLFSAVFALSDWHFIVDAELPNLSPYCAVFPDFFDAQPMVLVFTDKERLNKYVAETNLKIGSADKPVILNSSEVSVKFSSENLIMSVPTTSVIAFVESLTERGIKGIFFNPNKDSRGFHIGLPQLRQTKELVDSKKPKIEAEKIVKTADEPGVEIDFDALSRKTNESGGAMEDLSNLFGAALALPKWYFVARGDLPNVYPYVASRADYMNGQNFIRAFTDSDRLQRFAKENNLTDSQGSAMMLEIQTGNIANYLEQFIEQGADGVWFNSDTDSDGFSIPLKQLRPIQEYLAKIGWQAVGAPLTNPAANKFTEPLPAANAPIPNRSDEPLETVIIIVKDGVMLPSGDIKESTYFCDCFCRVPCDWIDGADVTEFAQQKLFETLYGKDWTQGNSDGSRYVVRKLNWKVYTPEKAKNFSWNAVADNAESKFFFFIVDKNGELQKISKEQFVADINSSVPTNAVAQPADNSSAQTADAPTDKNFDGYINWFRRGTIKFDTTFKPFFRAISPLLENYAGAGEFSFTFATGMDEPQMKDLFEDVTSNAHGAYLKYRSYVFQRISIDPTYEMQIIGSNILTNLQTGEKLLVQLTMHKKLENQEATLIVRFLGHEAEVEKLGNVVQPALDGCEFTVRLESKHSPSVDILKEIGG